MRRLGITILCLLGAACSEDAEPAAQQVSDRVPGPGDAVALEQLRNVNTSFGIAPEDVGVDVDGVEIALNQLELAIEPTATVAQINEALVETNASIVSSLPCLEFVLVEFPRTQTSTSLRALADRLVERPGIEAAELLDFPVSNALPDNIEAGSTGALTVGHQLAVGASGVWAARSSLPNPEAAPLLLIADFFGGGPPNDAFDVAADPADFPFSTPAEHGYHVLGILSGRFGGEGTQRGRVTGLTSAPFRLSAVDLLSGGRNPNQRIHRAHLQRALLDRIEAASGPVVVNTSLGFACSTRVSAERRCSRASAARQAARWIRKVRFRELEERFVHVTTAGNLDVSGFDEAEYNSEFAGARLLGDLTYRGRPVSPLTNTVVVESFDYGEGFTPRCLFSGSKRGGDIAAAGVDVVSTTGANAGAGPRTGTSMAAPQVAGALWSLWALQPETPPEGLIAALLRTARDPLPASAGEGCAGETSAPVLAARDTVLAADDAVALRGPGEPSQAPVRLALLDVAGPSTEGCRQDCVFDERDLSTLVGAFDATEGELDFGPHDLNGDGRTGGDGTARLDLSVDNLPLFEEASYSLSGGSVTLDEVAVRDVDVACFYAHSPLFTGDEQARDTILGDRCEPSGPTPGVTLQAWTVVAGGIADARFGSSDDRDFFNLIDSSDIGSPPGNVAGSVSASLPVDTPEVSASIQASASASSDFEFLEGARPRFRVMLEGMSRGRVAVGSSPDNLLSFLQGSASADASVIFVFEVEGELNFDLSGTLNSPSTGFVSLAQIEGGRQVVLANVRSADGAVPVAVDGLLGPGTYRMGAQITMETPANGQFRTELEESGSSMVDLLLTTP